jgi:predicted regulator of Ras-like GTPase activity (Roadblock/LC7/MglB family)
MGTFEQSFIVDGAEYELYRQSDENGFQLISQTGVVIASELSEAPDAETVAALVREQVADAA